MSYYGHYKSDLTRQLRLTVWSSNTVQSKQLLIRATLDGHIGKLVWVLPYGAYRPG